MKKAKTILTTALILAVAFIGFLFPSKAYAETLTDYEQIFLEKYQSIYSLNVSGGLNSSNEDVYYADAGAGISAGEQAETLSEGFLTTYRNEREVLMVAYKNVCKFKIDNSYDASELAPTENGVILVNQKVSETKSAINSATTKAEIDSAYNSFMDFIQDGGFVMNVTTLQMSSDSKVVATVTAQNKIFSPDDVLEVKPFKDSVIARNTKLAIAERVDLPVQNGGVACYLSVRWLRNGVITEKPSEPVTVEVDLSHFGVTAENGDSVCLARYLGNGEVEFSTATIENGKLTFTLTGFGGDIQTNYDLDFAVVLEGYPVARQSFMSQYWIVVVIALGVIVIAYIIVKIILTRKRTKKRKALKKFNKEYKAQAKQAKLDKKQAKLEKKKGKSAKGESAESAESEQGITE